MTTFLKNWGIPFSIGIGTIFFSLVATSYVTSRSLKNEKIQNAASKTFVTEANVTQSKDLTEDFNEKINIEAGRITENETNIEELDNKIDGMMSEAQFIRFEEKLWKKWEVMDNRVFELVQDKK